MILKSRIIVKVLNSRYITILYHYLNILYHISIPFKIINQTTIHPDYAGGFPSNLLLRNFSKFSL